MAITTLPYPNMDFVPLDVLKADELDHIVANIDAINNASIPTDSIADGAVTSGKIDWATLAPTSTTSTSSSMTWYKRVFPDGTIVYSGYGSPSWWTGGNKWLLDITIPLPDGLTFNSSKMSASINLQPADAAIQAWGSVHNGSSSWSIGRANRYTDEITTTVYINATLIVFPA